MKGHGYRGERGDVPPLADSPFRLCGTARACFWGLPTRGAVTCDVSSLLPGVQHTAVQWKHPTGKGPVQAVDNEARGDVISLSRDVFATLE